MTKAKESNNFLSRAVFFVGWLLSPATFWNDSFVNIPLSYILANIWIRLFPADFLYLVLVLYWLSNILGIYLMYLSGKAIIKDRQHAIKELAKLLGTVVIYSIILFLVSKTGVLKPL